MPSSRWDRPPPPHDWRWVVGTIGKVLISVGLLMFGFVAYQLWGTGIEYRQAQDALQGDFAALVGAAPSATEPASPTTTGPDGTAPDATETSAPTTEPEIAPSASVPDFSAGDVMAHLEIPSIGVDTYVVAGVQPADLKRGPGHYPDTPMPGQLGNSAIAGHRTTYGEPFYDLDELAVGDEIVVTTVQGRFVYRMTGSEIVAPSQSDVIATTDPDVAMLTLTTCHPRYTAAKRLIVYSDLDPEASAEPQAPIIQAAEPPEELAPTQPGGSGATATPPSTPGSAPDSTDPATTTAATATTSPAVLTPDDHADTRSADAFSLGWFSDDGAFAQVLLWGLVLTAIAIGAWLLSRRVRRNWVGALVGVVPFAIALYFFFQNVNRLLPPAL